MDSLTQHWKDFLKEAVAIQSVSGDPAKRDETIRMMGWAKYVNVFNPLVEALLERIWRNWALNAGWRILENITLKEKR